MYIVCVYIYIYIHTYTRTCMGVCMQIENYKYIYIYTLCVLASLYAQRSRQAHVCRQVLFAGPWLAGMQVPELCTCLCFKIQGLWGLNTEPAGREQCTLIPKTRSWRGFSAARRCGAGVSRAPSPSCRSGSSGKAEPEGCELYQESRHLVRI